MKQKGNSDSLFIKNELQAHANILKVTLSQIKQKSSNAEVIEMALKSFHVMSSILQNTQLKPLIPLFQSLHELFENISDPALIEEKWLDTLFSISKNLIQLSTLAELSFEKEILAREETINQWASQVNQVLVEIKQKSPRPKQVQPQPIISEGIVPDKSAVIKMDEALIQLFLTELQGQADKLKEDLTLHILNPLLEAPLKDWAQTARGVKQAADIIKLNEIVEVAETLENYAQALQEHKIKPLKENEEICFKMIDALSALSRLAPDHVSFFISERQKILAEWNKKLSSFLKSIPLKEESTHEAIKKDVEERPAARADLPLGDIMFDLFRNEMDTQCKILNQKLIEFEKKKDPLLLEDMMRAAHSIKGAARTLSLAPIAKMAHAMEDCFVSAQIQKRNLSIACIDSLFQVIDFFSQIGELQMSNLVEWVDSKAPLVEKLVNELKTCKVEVKKAGDYLLSDYLQRERPDFPPPALKIEGKKNAAQPLPSELLPERTLRVTAENLNRLMGMAGESLIESNRLYPLSENLQKMKNELINISNSFENFLRQISENELSENSKLYLTDLAYQINHYRSLLTEDLSELDSFIQRHENLSDRLYKEVINSRMRPFSDGVESLPRMVRDLAKQLDKKVKFEIEGLMVPVDRDVLEKLETPLTHLLRNAIDHGIETPQKRVKSGKPAEGFIKLKAYRSEGLLGITITDDGRGIDLENVRRKIVENNLASREEAERLCESEIIEFLFRPGFSTSEEITELSGRGVGLDIVRSTVQDIGGVVRVSSSPGKGVSFNLLLPLTLSVIRALLVEISGEAYAFPLARIDRAILIKSQEIELIENREFFRLESQNIGIFSACQLLGLQEFQKAGDQLPVVILNDGSNSYGLVVDRLIGEKELVLQKLSTLLGKVPAIAAGALMEDGSPVLVIDVEELLRLCENKEFYTK